ncbi:hypothetical protein Anapl_02716 [Anas platyrhynchos]|uniref:Uncharacterized protein n=1 Tax=Anas platyrhynchos TaxID=8839 RepID=R0JDX4_ANAPL|nr:hypothetical protein Anapl_02716 [Anas platyrhynchos]
MRKKGQLKAKREVCWPGRELQCNRRNETKKCGKQINSAINGECEIKRRKIGVEKGERIGFRPRADTTYPDGLDEKPDFKSNWTLLYYVYPGAKTSVLVIIDLEGQTAMYSPFMLRRPLSCGSYFPPGSCGADFRGQQISSKRPKASPYTSGKILIDSLTGRATTGSLRGTNTG